ncbi:hypothetical protein [Bacillus mesophilum]|uniref:Uncharacterized protein n=1 Tax=Bacillus mesophilum TaxID=1071718 RepID=A0A7V7RQH9_9BACI|nr:hypothetical protein [Bacillus mesophilum]KAB2335684.1 hypothetical protein F7732_03710 [Bacillus mesophilum]
MSKNNDVLFVVVPLSEVKRFLVLEMGVGTGVYYAFEAVFSSILVSMTGTMAITEGLKRGIPFLRKKCKQLHYRKFSHQWGNVF